MFEIPKPLKKVFDSFPIYSYPPIPNTTPSNNQSIEANKFYFTSASEKSEASQCFTLGVHNVYELQTDNGKKIVPSDPISLGHSLILCHKNGLKLPSLENSCHKTNHSIIKLSYHASPDNQLPILIEDDTKLQTRNIRSALSMNQSVKVNNKFSENPLARLINELIDIEFADVWILCLLGDLPGSNLEAFHKLFRVDDEIMQSTLASKITILSILNEIPKWGSFNVRYAYLFDHSKFKLIFNIPERAKSEGILEIFAAANNESIAKTYANKLEELENNLELLIEYIQTGDSSEQKEIIKLKLASFVIIIDSLLENTKLRQVLTQDKFNAFVKLCYKLIEKY